MRMGPAMTRVNAVISHGDPPEGTGGAGPVLRLDGTDPTTWPALAQPFLETHVKYPHQRCGVIMNGPVTEHELSLLRFVQHHYARGRVSQLTLQRFAKEWGRNYAATLRRAPPWAASLDEPLKGRPAFIVGAGPSLDGNGHLLRECKRRGFVIAVNTSVSACLHHGVVPDLVLACEALNLADHLAPLRGLGVPVVLDATANPANWAIAETAWAIAGCEPNTIPYTIRCGACPVPYTASVSCAATSLALLWGASPVVLVGQDLAYTGGRYYASGTPFADLAVRFEGGLVHVDGSSKTQEPVSVVHAERWGGGAPVETDYAMATILDWFERAADRAYLINATEGGCRIENSYEQRLERVLADLPVRDDAPVLDPQPCDTAALCDELRREAEAVLACDDPWAGVPASFPLLNMWTVEMGLDRKGRPHERAERRMRLMHQGAREVLEVIG